MGRLNAPLPDHRAADPNAVGIALTCPTAASEVYWVAVAHEQAIYVVQGMRGHVGNHEVQRWTNAEDCQSLFIGEIDRRLALGWVVETDALPVRVGADEVAAAVGQSRLSAADRPRRKALN